MSWRPSCPAAPEMAGWIEDRRRWKRGNWSRTCRARAGAIHANADGMAGGAAGSASGGSGTQRQFSRADAAFGIVSVRCRPCDARGSKTRRCSVIVDHHPVRGVTFLRQAVDLHRCPMWSLTGRETRFFIALVVIAVAVMLMVLQPDCGADCAHLAWKKSRLQRHEAVEMSQRGAIHSSTVQSAWAASPGRHLRCLQVCDGSLMGIAAGLRGRSNSHQKR